MVKCLEQPEYCYMITDRGYKWLKNVDSDIKHKCKFKSSEIILAECIYYA